MNSKILLTKWIEALNQHDADLIASFYHEDAINWQVADEPVRGKAQIRSMMAQFFTSFPDSYSRVENIMSDGEWAAWEWVGGGTFINDFAQIKATGKTYELRGCGFFWIINGKIKLQRGYWDKITWLSQIGIPISSVK